MTTYNKIIVLIACVATQAIYSQSLTQVQKLESTARIWGFLKYYHPQVAAGKYNWDDELIKLLPKVKQAETKEELSTLYINWIDGFGKIPVCRKCDKEVKDSFDKNFSMAWMENDIIFTPELSRKLKYIEENRLLGKKHYIRKKKGPGSLETFNEPEYNDFEYPAENYRLLTLFRFWNMAEYFFPYKYQADKKWDDVLVQSIVKVVEAKNALEYQLALTETVAQTDDSHAFINSNAASYIYGKYKVPFNVKLVEGKIIVTDLICEKLCLENDIQIGDIITHEDEKLLLDKFNANYKYYCASNKSVKNRFIEYILRGNSINLKIKFERDGVIHEKYINRYTSKEIEDCRKQYGVASKILNGNIGYADLALVKVKAVESIMDSFSNTKAIIFDLRTYPNYSVFALSQRLSYKNSEFAKIFKANLDYPGKFSHKKTISTGSSNSKAYKGKVIVLVNENTQSRGEFTVMALQAAANATVIGSQTAGADGEIFDFTLPGNFHARFTGNAIFYPDGRETQRIGIVPDIEIHPTIKGIRAGRDELLEKAIEVANQ